MKKKMNNKTLPFISCGDVVVAFAVVAAVVTEPSPESAAAEWGTPTSGKAGRIELV